MKLTDKKLSTCQMVTAVICLFACSMNVHSQAMTLYGDHIIEGNLDVGTSGSGGNLSVYGTIYSLGSLSLDGGISASGNVSTLGSFTSGYSYAGASYCFAMGESSAGGDYSLACNYSHAYGNSSSALNGSTAYADYSASFNWGISYGYNSTAMNFSMANGSYSTAMGFSTHSDSYASFVIGRNNVGGVDTAHGGDITWSDQDPLFEIGNGSGNPSDDPDVYFHNAFTVYKNGKIKMDRQGDVLMGEFGNPE